jgi:ABC-type nitrate/sulfonate/bicarbonate transport system substrate-binding protein
LTTDLRVIVFPGGFNLPMWAAERQGFFEEQGVRVVLTPTPSSTFQMQGLAEGRFDIAMTAFDNVVAYQEGQGEAEIPPNPDLFAFMGSDQGFLSVIGGKGVKTFADLKGGKLSVDAMTTGYAFVLRELLERNGVSDVSFDRAGGALSRFQELLKGTHAGTVLVGFVRAYRAGVEFLYANHDIAEQLLVANVSTMTPALAKQTLAVLLDERSGFFRDVRLDPEGMKTVLALRSKFGGVKLTDPDKYIS